MRRTRLDIVGAALLSGCAMAAFPSPVHGVVAFSGTGQDLFGDAAASFPTVTPVVSGTSLDFDALVDNEVLAVYPLAAAGSFPGPESMIATYTLGLTRLSDDFDPVFLVTDGTNVVGGQVGDNPNGSARVIEGTVAGSLVTVTADPLVFEGAGFPAIGESVDAVVEVVLEDASSEVTVAFLGTEETVVSSQVLDRNAALSFLLVANSAVTGGEFYRLDTVTLETEVPEPSAVAALCVGALVLGTFRGRAAASERTTRRT